MGLGRGRARCPCESCFFSENDASSLPDRIANHCAFVLIRPPLSVVAGRSPFGFLMIARLDCSSTIFANELHWLEVALRSARFQTGAFETGGDILSGSPMPFAAVSRPASSSLARVLDVV